MRPHNRPQGKFLTGKDILLLLLLLLLSVPSLAQQKATPRKGEGIGTFLERNGRPSKVYYDEFMELNRKNVKNGQLLLGVQYILPELHTGGKAAAASGSGDDADPKPSDQAVKDSVPEVKAAKQPETGAASSSKSIVGTKKKEPLFGKASETVTVESDDLQGACFYLVSGHGGPDPGAIGKQNGNSLHEDEYAYDVILRLARALMQQGADVRIIIQDKLDGIRDGQYLATSKRETCMGKAIPLSQVERLKQRCDAINGLYEKDKTKYKYLRAVFIHVDSRSKSQQTDVFFYYNSKQSGGQRLANTVKTTFENKYKQHQPGRGFSGTVETRNLYVLEHTTPTCLFAELGNIQNAQDQKRFVLSANRQALANWMAEGVKTDFKAATDKKK